jgi:hypothetical protein
MLVAELLALTQRFRIRFSWAAKTSDFIVVSASTGPVRVPEHILIAFSGLRSLVILVLLIYKK